MSKQQEEQQHEEYIKKQNQNGEFCHDSKLGCQFNKESKKIFFTIGDSIISGLNLKNKLVEKGYQFNIFTKGNCLYYIGFDKFNFQTQKKLPCNNEYFSEIKKKLSNEKGSIILFGGNVTSQLDNSDLVLKNQKIISFKGTKSDFVPIGKYKTLQDSFRYEVSQFSKDNKIIFLYPIDLIKV